MPPRTIRVPRTLLDDVPGVRDIVTSERPWPSIASVIGASFRHRPWCAEALNHACDRLARLFNTPVSWTEEHHERSMVYGMGRRPLGYTGGPEVIVTMGLATTDTLREIHNALQDLAPVGLLVRVRAADGRSNDDAPGLDALARRAYNIERREPAPQTYDLGDGLTLSFGASTYVGPGKLDDIKVELRVPGRTVWEHLLDDVLDEEAA